MTGAATTHAGTIPHELVPPAAPVPAGPADQHHGELRELWQQFTEDRSARIGYWLLVAIVACCALLPLAWPWEATRVDRSSRGAEAPSLAHPLGTDSLGRDQVARLLAAGRVSLTIGLVVAIASSVIGALVGIVAGYVGGRVDELLMLVVDVLLTVPPLPLLIAVAGLVASGAPGDGLLLERVPEMWRIVIVMSLLGWMTIARVVRTEVLQIRGEPYIEAARAIGADDRRIMFTHVSRNVVRPMLVFCAMSVSAAIMGESGLSFLGMGVSPPEPTWGNMIAESGNVFMFRHNWWIAWTPAVAIVATIMALNFVTDGLQRALLDD